MNETNPYDPPAEESPAPEPESESSPRILRSGAFVALAVLWNAPMLIVMCLVFAGTISVDNMDFLLACWAATIPFAMLAAAYVKPLQRVLFLPGFDVARIRPQLFGAAILWIVLSGIWIGSILLGG